MSDRSQPTDPSTSARPRRESCIRWSVLVRMPEEVRGIVDDFGEILHAALIAGFDEGPSEREAFNVTLSRGMLEDLRDLASDSEEIVATWESSFGETSDRLRRAVADANAKLQKILVALEAAVDAELAELGIS